MTKTQLKDRRIFQAESRALATLYKNQGAPITNAGIGRYLRHLARAEKRGGVKFQTAWKRNMG